MHRSWPTLALALLLAACRAGTGSPGPGGGGAGGGGAGGGAPDLAERLAAGQVRAGRIARPEELPGGPESKARLGDLKLYNDRVWFVIEDARPSSGYCPFGGGLADADLVRAPGSVAATPFEELIFAFDQRAFRPDRVEVIEDGGGGPARVRATGRDAPMPVLDAFLQVIAGTENGALDLDVTIDYALAPESDALEITITLDNPGDDRLVNAVQAGVLPGTGLQLVYPGYGFEPATSEVPWLGGAGPEVSFLLDAPEAGYQSTLSYQGLTIGTFGELRLPSRGSGSRSLRLVLGDGSVADVLARREALQASAGPRTLVDLSGTVRDGASPVAGARVHLDDLALPSHKSYHATARSGADGTFVARVPKGRYRLLPVADGRAPGATAEVDVGAGGASVELQVGGQGRIEVAAVDEAGGPLPVKVVVMPLAPATPVAARYGEPPLPRGATAFVFAHTGSASVPVPPGTYDVVVARGLEYEAHQERVEVTAGGQARVRAQLARTVDTTGWLSGDFHLHASPSPDSEEPLEDKVAAIAAEGLEVPVSTEHEVIADYGPAVRELELSRWIFPLIGEEVSTIPFGHWNAFPLRLDPGLPNAGAFDWYGKHMRDIVAEMRAHETNPIVQLNHPRSSVAKGYFTMIGFDTSTFEATDPDPDDLSLDFDAMEVMNGPSVGQALSQGLPDWWAFLDRGRRVTGTGTSDSHGSRSDPPGYPRTYVRSSTDEPSGADEAELVASIRGGRCVVSSGVFVTARVGSAGPGETARAEGGRVAVDVEVQAPSWIGPVEELQVVFNSEVVTTVAIAAGDADPARPARRFFGTLDIQVPRDGWIVVLARAPGGSVRPVIDDGNAPFGFTNPIWIDADGDGTITPPGAP